MTQPHIVVMGAGAVGGYVAGHLARAGEDVTIVDPWTAHVDAIQKSGLRVSGTQGDHTVRIEALHVCDAQRLMVKPVDIVLVSTKSFDTAWAVTLLKDYLSSSSVVVSMQNGINEEGIAGIVGWGKTMGCVVNTIGVRLVEPGHIARDREPGGAKHAVFRVGEVNGLISERAKDIARRLECIDSAVVTTNLWGERWAKLTTNSMSMGILGATGMNKQETIDWDKSRNLSVRAAAEGVLVGRALGYEIEPIFKVAPEHWVGAAAGDPKSKQAVEEGFAAYLNRLTPFGRTQRDSMGRDAMAGRRTEVDFLNGTVAAKGEELGLDVPVNRGLTTIIRRIERRELTCQRENILPLCT